MKTFTINFSEISKDKYLRNDVKYHYFLHILDWNLFNTNRDTIKLKYILSEDYNLFDYKDNEEYKGIPTGQQYLDEDGKIINYQLVTKDEHPGRLKYKISNDNILISSLRLAKSPALMFENKDLNNYVFSNGFYIFCVHKNWNKKFVLYILRTKKLKKLLDNNLYRGIGISAYKVEDLLKIKIPKIPKTKQDKIVSQIEPVEKEIKNLKSQIKEPQEIINKVFAREFRFDEELYYEFGKGMSAGTQFLPERKLKVFNINFSDLSKSDIFRFSTRFHNSPTQKLMKILDNIKTFKLKNIIIEPIHRGNNPKYDDNGLIPVIKTNHLKNSYIELSEEEFVNEGFYQNHLKSQVKKSDVLLASTGKGSLGKVDIVNFEKKAVVDSHISIIRIDYKVYNPLFLTYFLRSILGIFQIERDYTGTTNQIELYSKEISNFQIPNIPLSHQQKIVDEIKKELDKQKEMKRKIEKERNKIDEIIEEAIK